MKKTDVMVIGESAAGVTAAMTAKLSYPDKNVTVISKVEKVMIPCGIPYIFGTVGSTDNNISPDEGLVKLGVEIVVDEVSDVDVKAKICKTKNGEEFVYEKLIICTGSLPAVPGWLEGRDLANVFTIPKEKDYLDRIQHNLQEIHKIVVVGGGFIGVEVSDELNKAGKNVTLIEILPHILGMTLDDEFAIEAEKIVAERGVTIKTNRGVERILGDGKVSGVQLKSGEVVDADAVILSMGYLPNTALAKKMGLELNAFGFIKVDQYGRTSIPDVYAAGDCAEKVDFA
ncbi:MAG: NAD(P)/FAD-dependent oxidoreductase, partial [Anaerolineales bacterium]